MTSVVVLWAEGYKRMMIVSLLQLGLASQPDTIGFLPGCGAGLCILDRVYNIGILRRI